MNEEECLHCVSPPSECVECDPRENVMRQCANPSGAPLVINGVSFQSCKGASTWHLVLDNLREDIYACRRCGYQSPKTEAEKVEDLYNEECNRP